ncbi:uncharacterized protein B0H18DRAFT_988069, partial [Fomitopsis serialis]|uniref:uncharacterized protein n=1 Tax=Fomitopsis serialis TaxID=139415 RepID=UPI002007F433
MGNKRHAAPKVVEGRYAPDFGDELQVHAAHASQLQARLLATLDKIDALRATHIHELGAEKRAVDVLSHKLDRYRRYVKEARAEWDDTREALSIVIEKVELANDYSLWPHSQLCMTYPLEPLSCPKASSSNVQLNKDSAHPYAKAIITSLREELEQERTAHADTRARAEAEILSLNARLAQRDAELEARILQGSASQLPLRASKQSPPAPEQHRSSHRDWENAPLSFSQEEAIQIMELTAARNRELEAEVHHLLERRDQAQQPNAPLSAPGRTAETEKEQLGIPDALPEYRREDLSSVPMQPGAQLQVHPPVSHATLLPPDRPALGPTRLHSQGSTAESDTLVPRSTAIQQLQQLVGIFAAQLDGFASERDALKGVLAAQGQGQTQNARPNSLAEDVGRSDGPEGDDGTGGDRGLRAEVSSLRMVSRESTDVLVDPDETARVDTPRTGKIGGPGTQSPQKPSDCSMELATPLQPTIVSVREDISDLGGAPPNLLPPLLVPLPPSPDSPDPPASPQPERPEPLLPSIDLSPPFRDPPLWWPHPRSPHDFVGDPYPSTDAARRLEVIECELALARQELEAKNEELGELRDVVEQLRELVYSGSLTTVKTGQQRGGWMRL